MKDILNSIVMIIVSPITPQDKTEESRTQMINDIIETPRSKSPPEFEEMDWNALKR